jgi:hypothetical protein
MPITLDWYDLDQTIILVRFIGNWTMEEYAACGEGINLLVRTNSQRVLGMVVDGGEAGSTPKNALAGLKQVLVEGKLPLVLVNMRRDVRIMVDSLRRSYFSSRAVYYAYNLPEAITLLHEDHAKQART